MKIYNYHPITCEFLGEGLADPSPLESEVFLIPANATDFAPPKTKANQVAVFLNNEWQLKPDHRGEKYYTADGAEVEITEIGVTRDPSWLDAKPLPPLATLIANALTRIDQAHAEFLLKAVGNPTQVEINTWPLKLEIKNAILAELPLNQEQQAFVDSAGLDTPAKQTAWAQSVQAKSAYSAHATGVAEAVRDTAKELVKAAQTAEELEAVMQQLSELAGQKLAEVLALKG